MTSHFNPLRYQPKPIYGTELFTICNPNKHLATDYGKVTTMAAILFALEGIKGFQAPEVPADCSIDEAFAILMDYVYNFDKLPNSWATAGTRKLSVPKLTCASVDDDLLLYATYTPSRNKCSLPVYYIPWLQEYDKELAELWIGAIGALGELSVFPLSQLCEGGEFYEEFLEQYTPKAWEEKIGAVDKKYKPLFNSTKARYGKNGAIWQLAQRMDSIDIDACFRKYLEYKERKAPAKADIFRNTIMGMIDLVLRALTSGQTLLNYNHLSELELSEGVVPVMMYYQVLWQYDNYDTCEEAMQPDLMTRIHTIHILDRSEQCGMSECKVSMQINPGVPAREPEVLLADILNELFASATRFADKYFDYDPSTGSAVANMEIIKPSNPKK